MSMRRFIVYVITNTVNDARYIGATSRGLRSRWNDHQSAARRGVDTPLYRAIRKHGVDRFTITELASAVSFEALLDLERTLIAQEGTHVSSGGYNATFGGDGTLGWIPTPETREKIREASRRQMEDPMARAKLSALAKKQWGSLEARAQVSARRKGAVASDETKRKLSEALKGRFVSEETREKLRQRFKGKPRPPHVQAILRSQKRSWSREDRLRMSHQRVGRKFSAETKQRMRDAWVLRRQRKVSTSEEKCDE